MLWLAYGVSVVASGRPRAEASAAIAVSAVATGAGLVTALSLGLSCFHCSGPTSSIVVFGGAAGVAIIVGLLGGAVAGRLIASSSARRSFLAALGASITGASLALVVWIAVFSQSFVFAPPRYPTLEAARPAAESALGRHRWPGSTVRFRQMSPELVLVERRWLGLDEAELEVRLSAAGWDVGEPTAGPGRALQSLVACVVPALAVAGALFGRLSRRRA